MIALDIEHSLGLINRSSSRFLRLALLAASEDEEGAAESSDEDNRDGDSSYSCCTNAVGTIAGGLDDCSNARGWTGSCGTSCVGMGYGYDMTWRRRVESCLRNRKVGLFVIDD